MFSLDLFLIVSYFGSLNIWMGAFQIMIINNSIFSALWKVLHLKSFILTNIKVNFSFIFLIAETHCDLFYLYYCVIEGNYISVLHELKKLDFP